MPQLAQLIRTKYPGEYDDLSDSDLEKAIIAKYPEYADLATKDHNNPSTTQDTQPSKEPSSDEIIKGAKSFLSDSSKSDNKAPTQKPEDNQPESKSFLSKAWDKVSQPLTDFPTKAAAYLADKFEHPALNDSETVAKLKGFAGGTLEGVGQVASSLTSPLNIALTAVGAGEASPELEAMRPALTTARRVLSAPVAAEGAYHTYQAPTIGGKLQGIAEAAAGLAGTKGAPESSPELNLEPKVSESANETPQSVVDRMKASLSPENESPKSLPDEYIDNSLSKVDDYIRDRDAGKLTDTYPFTTNSDNEPSFAKTKGGGVKIGADVRSLGKVLGSSLYQGDISTIATKELLQNSIDATRHLGENGNIDVHFNDKTHQVEVADNGKGLTPSEIQTIFTDLGSSGKRDDASAIGGFGLAKAAPLLGGKHVEVETVANQGGNLIRTRFSGTPDELLDGVNLEQEKVPNNTPTGTRVKVTVPDDQRFYNARDFVQKAGKFSDIKGNINIKRTSQFTYDDVPSSETLQKPLEHNPVADLSSPSANVKLSIPNGDAADGDRSSIELILSNNGMYQGTTTHYLPQQLPNLPKQIIVDINSKVPEGHPDYPFTANRENLRGSIEKQVQDYIKNEIVEPGLKKRLSSISDLYNGMKAVPNGDLNTYFHDTGSQYTPEEYNRVTTNPTILELGKQIHSNLQQAIESIGKPAWKNKLEKSGIVFDSNLRGVHIPNPGAEKSAILINPLQLMAGREPDEAAAGFVHTILHELAHVEVSRHNEDFTVNLGNIYEKYGARNTVKAQDAFINAVTKNGEYAPEIQNLLQEYQTSRGRAVVKDDALTRTGVGQRTPRGPEDDISRNPQQSGEGADATSNEDIFNRALGINNSPKFGAGRGIAKDIFPTLGDTIEVAPDNKPKFNLDPRTQAMLSRREPPSPPQANDLLSRLARLGTKTTRAVLGFHLPGTAISFHGVNEAIRNTLFGESFNPLTAGRRLGESINYLARPGKANDYLVSNMADAAKAVKDGGLTLNTTDIGNSSLFKGNNIITKGFNYLTNPKPLFQQVIPALKLKSYGRLLKQMQESGMSYTEAAKTAGYATNNIFGGLNLQALERNITTQKLFRTFALAPDWIETNARLGSGMAKGITNPSNPAYKSYQVGAANFLGAYVVGNIINAINNDGKFSFQNDPGHELDVAIGKDSAGRVRYIRPFGTAMDMVRIPLAIAHAAQRGSVGQSFQMLRDRMSEPAQFATDMITNTDWKGAPILDRDKYGRKLKPKDQAINFGNEVMGHFAPTGIDSAVNMFQGKISPEEGMSRILQLPVGYKKPTPKKYQ